MLPPKIVAVVDDTVIKKAAVRAYDPKRLGKPGECLVTDSAQIGFPELRYPCFKEKKVDGIYRGVLIGVARGQRGYWVAPDDVTELALYVHDNGCARYLAPFRYPLVLIDAEDMERAEPKRQAQASSARKRFYNRNPEARKEYGKPGRLARFQERMEQEHRLGHVSQRKPVNPFTTLCRAWQKANTEERERFLAWIKEG